MARSPARVTMRVAVGGVTDQLHHLRAVGAQPGAQVAQDGGVEGLEDDGARGVGRRRAGGAPR